MSTFYVTAQTIIDDIMSWVWCTNNYRWHYVMGLMHKQLSVTLCHGSNAQTIIGDIMSWVWCTNNYRWHYVMGLMHKQLSVTLCHGSVVIVIFCKILILLKWEVIVCFVDIGGIVDQYYLNVLFILTNEYKWILVLCISFLNCLYVISMKKISFHNEISFM